MSLVASQDTYRGQFKFDRRFFHQPNIKKAITLAWNSPHYLADASVSHRIHLCRRTMSKLKKVNSLNSKSRILDLHAKLEREQSSDFPNFNHIHLLKLDIMKAYKDEESFRSQKSKERWANSGDKNTKFFHASVKANRAKKSIEMLLDGNGRENRSEASKGMVAVDFFTSLFSSTNPSDFSELFQDFIPRVTHSMNVELIRNVTSLEVKEALFSINPSKAPGADGMTSLFFQQFWEVVGNQVTSEVCNFFETVICLQNGTIHISA